ncbi:hypothetical protein RJG79_08370 [Mycoplasmatota bacterium WC44]
MLTQLKIKIAEYLLSADRPRIRITPESTIWLGSECTRSDCTSNDTHPQKRREPSYQQTSHRVKSDLGDSGNDEKFVSLSTPEQASELFAEYILDHISMFIDVSVSEGSDVELWMSSYKKDYELFVMVSNDVALLALGLYEII